MYKMAMAILLTLEYERRDLLERETWDETQKKTVKSSLFVHLAKLRSRSVCFNSAKSSNIRSQRTLLQAWGAAAWSAPRQSIITPH
jgi:hypothetical protein